MTESTINTIALTAIFFGQAFATWQTTRSAAKSSAAKAAAEASSKRIENKVDLVHAQGNSVRVATLRQTAVIARRLATVEATTFNEEVATRTEAELRQAELDQASIPAQLVTQANFPDPPPKP